MSNIFGTKGAGRQFESKFRIFNCKACQISMDDYEMWVRHLTSKSHLSKMTNNIYPRHETWKEKSIRNNCMIVKGVKNYDLYHLMITVSHYFGIILDLISSKVVLHRSVDEYFIQFDSEESVFAILSVQKKATHNIQFRRKYERIDPLQENAQPTSSAVSLESGPILYRSLYPRPSNQELGKVRSELSDDHMFIFGQKMTEHFAENLSHLQLPDQLEEFMKNILVSDSSLYARSKFIDELLQHLKQKYQKCRLFSQGPDQIGIANGDDAVVVYVDVFDNVLKEDKKPGEQSSDNSMGDVFEYLKPLRQTHSYAGFIKKLRMIQNCWEEVPTITFTHVETLTRCIIRAQSFEAVQECALLKYLSTRSPLVRPLLVLIRYWSSYHQIFDDADEGMRNRLVVLLMIFHLMNEKVIPTLSELQALDHKKMIWRNQDISFHLAEPSTDKAQAQAQAKAKAEADKLKSTKMLELLQKFFQKFANRNLKKDAVCLWPAKFIPKTELTPNKKYAILSPGFAKKIRTGADGRPIYGNINPFTPICVQSFFNQNENVSNHIPAQTVERFQQLCLKTSEKLQEIINSSTPYLMNIFLDNSADLESVDSKDNNPTTTISSTITQEHEKQRQSLQASATAQNPREQLKREFQTFSKSLEQRLSVLPKKPLAPVRLRTSMQAHSNVVLDRPNPKSKSLGPRTDAPQEHSRELKQHSTKILETSTLGEIFHSCESSSESEYLSEDEMEEEEVQITAPMRPKNMPDNKFQIKLANSTKSNPVESQPIRLKRRRGPTQAPPAGIVLLTKEEERTLINELLANAITSTVIEAKYRRQGIAKLIRQFEFYPEQFANFKTTIKDRIKSKNGNCFEIEEGLCVGIRAFSTVEAHVFAVKLWRLPTATKDDLKNLCGSALYCANPFHYKINV